MSEIKSEIKYCACSPVGRTIRQVQTNDFIENICCYCDKSVCPRVDFFREHPWADPRAKLATAPMPATIQVVGLHLPLLLRNADVDTFLDGHFGYCDHKRSQIVLNDANSPDQMKETTLHEIVHSIEQATKIDLEEEEVHRLSRALFAVIRDNPALITWLQASPQP